MTNPAPATNASAVATGLGLPATSVTRVLKLSCIAALEAAAATHVSLAIERLADARLVS
jgi:hypothetical protein